MSYERSTTGERQEQFITHNSELITSLDTQPTRRILAIINREDRRVAPAVDKVLSRIARAVELAVEALARGGRLVYLGAGTSGRLGVLDAAECVPTFNTNQVVGLLAGAPRAMFHSSEAKEDDPRLAVRDLNRIRFNSRDVLVGISASGTTPYTLGGLRYARRLRAWTIALTSNPRSPLARLAHIAIAPRTGPEVISGSTRMKAGTAQKLVLNMLSTATMIRLGRVLSSWMVNVRMTNRKLVSRGETILREATGASAATARRTLAQSGRNLPVALLMLWKKVSKARALELLAKGQSPASVLRAAWAEATRDQPRVARASRP